MASAFSASIERIPIYVGVDASVKRDSTALVAVTFDKKAQMVRLVQQRVFTPASGDPIDFEHTVEAHACSSGDCASSCAKFYSTRSK